METPKKHRFTLMPQSLHRQQEEMAEIIQSMNLKVPDHPCRLDQMTFGELLQNLKEVDIEEELQKQREEDANLQELLRKEAAKAAKAIRKRIRP